MKIALIFIVFIMFFQGCGSDKRVVVAKKQELPSWYTSSARTNSTELYSVGEGQNREDAVANALSMMISTLNISISSQFNSKSVIKEGQTSSNTATYTNEVQSDVQKIRISNYELVESKSIGFKRHIVLVKSNKKKLFESMKKEIDQKLHLVESKKSELKNQNTIKKIGAYQGFRDSLVDMPNTLSVMGALDASFNDAKYLLEYEKIEKEYEALVSSLTFSVSSNAQANNLKSAISKGVSAKKLKISNSRGKNHFKIHISSKIEKATSYGFTLARSAIDINIKDYKGVIIGSNKLNITGQSTQGYNVAKENVAFKLNEMIKKEGILKVIGLKI